MRHHSSRQLPELVYGDAPWARLVGSSMYPVQ